MLRLLLTVTLVCSPAVAEGTCFRTAAEAALGSGSLDEAGYYLVVVRTDRFTGEPWAAVARCGHPELPVSLLRASLLRASLLRPSLLPSGARLETAVLPVTPPAPVAAKPGTAEGAMIHHVRVNRLTQRGLPANEPSPALPAAPRGSVPVVLAGRPVRVLWNEGSARGELGATAMGNARAGERVQVRMAGLIAGAQERIVSGTAQADGTLILEAGR